jgi:hypothetical protein
MAIKQKGVCDVCTKEFELNGGSFGVSIINVGNGEINVSIFPVKSAPDGVSHVCGKACLYRMLDSYIDQQQNPIGE